MKAPVAMPTVGVAMQTFELQRVDYTAPEASGRIGGVQAGFPLWSATYTLTRMEIDTSDEWRAFFRGLRGQTRRFIGFDLSRLLPRAYMDSGLPGGFSGAASSWSSTINSDGDCVLTLNGLPVGFQISQCDNVDFRYTATEDAIAGLPWRALVSAQEDATANGSGTASFIVEPAVPTNCVPPTAVAHLDNPGCTMVMVGDQSNLGSLDRLYSIDGGQITAVQDLRA